MKKIYCNPTIQVVKIAATQQMLAGSTPKLSGTYGGDEVLGRSNDLDFDD